MAGRQPVTDQTTVYSVLFQFLGWNKQHREESTHEFYKRHIVSFAEYIGETLTVGELKPFHVTKWLDECYPKTRKAEGKTVAGASDNYRRSAIRSVQRPFNWAVEQGYLKASPIAKVKKPAYKPRDTILTPEQWEQLLAALEVRANLGDTHRLNASLARPPPTRQCVDAACRRRATQFMLVPQSQLAA